MKMYEENNLPEWSRKLRTKYGNNFRLYSDDNETLERWSVYLSNIFGFHFEVLDNEEETLFNWSKLIGG